MQVSLRNGVTRIEIWPFTDGTVSVLIYFNSFDNAHACHDDFEALGFEVSHVGIGQAFAVKDLHVQNLNGPLNNPADATLTYNEYDLAVVAGDTAPSIEVNNVRD